MLIRQQEQTRSVAYMGDPAGRPDPVSSGPLPATDPARPARLAVLLQACTGLAAAGFAWRLTDAIAPALVAGLLVPVLIHGAILAVGFLIAWLAAEPPADPAHRWIGTWLREWPRSMRAVYQLLAWREGFPTPAPGPGPRRHPVVLIHCFAGNRGLWSVSAAWFASRGHPLVIPSFTPADGDIDGHVEPLRAALSRAADLAEAPGLPVHLVAHSMGGLIARAYLRRYGWDGIGAVVTLGTPHLGTPQAWFGAGRACHQMRPRSDWLRRLAGEEPLAPPRQMVTVVSRQDNVTAIPSLQTVPLARPIRLGGLGHMSYVFEPRIIDLVLRILASVERHWQQQQALAGHAGPQAATADPLCGSGSGSGRDRDRGGDSDGGSGSAPTGEPAPLTGGAGRADPRWVEPRSETLREDGSSRVEPWFDEGADAAPPPDGQAPDRSL